MAKPSDYQFTVANKITECIKTFNKSEPPPPKKKCTNVNFKHTNLCMQKDLFLAWTPSTFLSCQTFMKKVLCKTSQQHLPTWL